MKITVDLKKLDLRLKNTASIPKQLIQDGYQFFKDATPIDQGNARRSTTLNGNRIEANYPYASVLEAGRRFTQGQWRGSRQAPNGMIEPTRRYMRQRVKQLTKKV